MVDATEKDGKLFCVFSGRLDSVVCSNIEALLMEKVVSVNMPVVFDLAKVEFVSSSFLRIVIRVAKKVGLGNLTLMNVSPNVREVFVISGLDEQLNIF